MASSIAATTMPRSITFSRATASAICKSSSLLAETAMRSLLLERCFLLQPRGGRLAGCVVGTRLAPDALPRVRERFRARTGAVVQFVHRVGARGRAFSDLRRTAAP